VLFGECKLSAKRVNEEEVNRLIKIADGITQFDGWRKEYAFFVADLKKDIPIEVKKLMKVRGITLYTGSDLLRF